MDNTSASLISLKAELFRKREEVKGSGKELPSTVRGRILSKKPTDKKNRGVAERALADEVLSEKEIDQFASSAENLKKKAQLYEQLQSGAVLDDSNGPLPYLVDFEQKVIDAVSQIKQDAECTQSSHSLTQVNEQLTALSDIPLPSELESEGNMSKSEEHVNIGMSQVSNVTTCADDIRENQVGTSKHNFTNVLNQSNIISDPSNFNQDVLTSKSSKSVDLMSNDMYREQLRQKWEEEENQKLSTGDKDLHYSDVRYDEARTHGAAFYQFSQDSSKREEQMAHLKKIREQSEKQRLLVEEKRRKKKEAMSARLAKVRQRKGIAEPPKTEELDLDFTAATVVTLLVREERPKDAPVREWDKGKDIDRLWFEKKEKIREERIAEFAPPTNYDQTNHHNFKRKRFDSNVSASDNVTNDPLFPSNS